MTLQPYSLWSYGRPMATPFAPYFVFDSRPSSTAAFASLPTVFFGLRQSYYARYLPAALQQAYEPTDLQHYALVLQSYSPMSLQAYCSLALLKNSAFKVLSL